MNDQYVERVIDLTDPARNRIHNMTLDEARARLASRDPEAVRAIDGSFALVARDGQRVVLARSLDRPLRYFLAKQADGPALVVADRIDAIHALLRSEGLDGPVPSELHAHGAGALRRRDRAASAARTLRPRTRASSRPSATRCPPDLDAIGRALHRRPRPTRSPSGCARFRRTRADRRLLLRRHRQRRRVPRGATTCSRLRRQPRAAQGVHALDRRRRTTSRRRGAFLGAARTRAVPRGRSRRAPAPSIASTPCASSRTTSRSTSSPRRWRSRSAAASASGIPSGASCSTATAATRTSRTIRSRRTRELTIRSVVNNRCSTRKVGASGRSSTR